MRKHLYITCNKRELHVHRWGDPARPAVIVWHGLTRNGNDFAPLARALSKDFCVYAPDTIGRGLSQWAQDDGEYRLLNYAALARALMHALGITRCRWVGTSMGGLIGMIVANQDARIERLLINDVAPELPAPALQRIVQYAGAAPVFPTVGALEKYIRQLYAGFGALSDDEWREMAAWSYRRVRGGVTLNHDPRIVSARDGGFNPLWDVFHGVTQPTLLLRGGESDILSEDAAARMVREGKNCRLLTFADCGHAPYLNTNKQINTVRAFCLAAD